MNLHVVTQLALRFVAARARRIRIVPALLPGADPDALASYGLDDTAWFDLRQGVDAGWQPLVALLGETGVRDGSADDAPNPYPGPRPFGESDAKAFFGREVEIGQLAAILGQSSFVVLQGPAQVGKSSLVLAGLVPHLRRREMAPLRPLLDRKAQERSGAESAGFGDEEKPDDEED